MNQLLYFTILVAIALILSMSSAEGLQPVIPHECQKIGICQKVSNYPEDVVNRIIAKMKPQLELLKVEQLDKSTRRFENNNMKLCQSREEIIVPEAIKGKDNNWAFLLNNKHNPFQGYRIEICQNAGQSCSDNIFQPYGGYTTECVQKYSLKTALAVDVEKEVVFDLPVRIPTCCSCVVSHNGKK